MVYRFYCIALFQSQTRRHMLNLYSNFNTILIKQTVRTITYSMCSQMLYWRTAHCCTLTMAYFESNYSPYYSNSSLIRTPIVASRVTSRTYWRWSEKCTPVDRFPSWFPTLDLSSTMGSRSSTMGSRSVSSLKMIFFFCKINIA